MLSSAPVDDIFSVLDVNMYGYEETEQRNAESDDVHFYCEDDCYQPRTNHSIVENAPTKETHGQTQM